MMHIKQGFKLLILTLLLHGCSTHSNYFTPFESSKVDLSTPRANNIIHDFLTIVKTYYSPAKTVFMVESTNSPFAINIENELRKEGYGVGSIYGKNLQQYNLSWNVNYLNKTMIQVSFQLEDAKISRVYKLNSNRYYPFSPLSAVGLNKKKLARLDFSRLSSQEYAYDSNYNNVSAFAKVKATRLKIRTQPTRKSKSIATLKKGDRVSYQEIITNAKGEEWIKLKNGGYMKASYLQL